MAENGVGGAFVLALSPLAFCGGFDIEDPEILAEAAIRVGRRWFPGEQGLLEASAAVRRGAFASGPPLAPVG